MSYADEFLRPSSDETLPAVREVELSRDNYSVGDPGPNWIFGENVMYTPYEERLRIEGPGASLERERVYRSPKEEDVIYGQPGYYPPPPNYEEEEFNPEDVDWERYKGKFRYDFEPEEPYVPFEGPTSEQVAQDWRDKKKAEEARKYAKQLEDLENMKYRVKKAEGQRKLESLGATPFSKAKKVLRETSKAAEFARKASTLGGAIKLEEKNRKYYTAPGMTQLTSMDSIRGARRLTSMQGTRESQSAGNQIAAPLRGQAKPNLQSLREAGRPKGLRSGMPSSGSPMTRGIPGLGRLVEASRPPAPTTHGAGSSPIGILSRGGNPTSTLSPIALKATSSAAPQRGLSPLEVKVIQAAERTPQADTRSMLIAEVATGGVSKSEAGTAIDSLVRKGVMKKFTTHSGEPVLEVV